jgi:hypothetical protein
MTFELNHLILHINGYPIPCLAKMDLGIIVYLT